MIKKISITMLLALCLWGVSGSVVLAQRAYGPDPEGLITCGRDSSVPKFENGKELPLAQNCGFADLINLINTLINYLIMIAMPLAAIAFAYAGWLYLTAGGDTGKVSKAHTIFLDVGVGFILILSSWLIFTLISKTFLSTQTDSNGNTYYKTYLN